MAQFGINFGGRTIVHPGGYSVIDSTSMVVSTDGSTNIPIVLGTADAGQPGVVKWFTNLQAARDYLRGGELLDALQLMFSPIPEGGGGSSLIGVVIVNPNSQATLTAGGGTYTSLEYGDGGNKIQLKLEDGTNTGSKKLTVSRWDLNVVEVHDNLGSVFSLLYNGAQAYAEATVVVSGGVATRFQTKTGASSATAVLDLDVDLADARFSTVGQLVAYLNSVFGYDALVISPDNNDMLSSGLDAVAATPIKTQVNIMGLKANIASRVNAKSVLVSASVTGTVANFATTSLTGGVKGVAPASWATNFDTIKSNFSDVLVVLSGSESIHAEALTHVGQMEARKQKQVLFTGGLAGETSDKTKQRALSLNNSRAVLAWPGIKHPNIGNGKTVLPPYMTAAMIAGRVTGVDPSEPVTFDYFNLVSLEVDLITGDPKIEDLLSAGVCTLERTYTGGIRLVQGITTYTGSNNVLLREISVRRGADKVDEKVTRALEDTFIGSKSTSGSDSVPATDSAIKTRILDVLEEEKRLGNISDYLDEISVVFSGTAVYADYQVAPAEPINFVLLRSHFIPASSISSNQ